MKFVKNHKKFISIIIVIAFFLPLAALARGGGSSSIVMDTIKNGAVTAVGWIVYGWVWIIGQLCVLLIAIIIDLAKYNEFVTSSAVENGWVIVRDVVNMFFILILLVIAFATIFNVKEYKYQAMLPRLLIMAVVINFSRTIAGVLIDFGQVVMLTFVNGFQAAAGGNFIKALKIEELLKFDETLKPGEGMDLLKVFASFILAAIMITVTAVVLGAFAIMLVMRIVTLWFLVVLSPIAFLASVWPSGRIRQKYALWWDMFLDNIMVGPILAFFLWLSLLVLGSGDVAKVDGVVKSTYEQESGIAGGLSAGYTQIGKLDNMISYLMGIGMLLGSLYMAQSMRAAGAGIAGAALGKMKGYASAAVRKPTYWAGKKVYNRAARTARGAAVGALGGLSKVPILGRLTMKPLGNLQKAQQKQAQEDTAYISGLTTEQRTKRTKQLEALPIRTESQKNQLAALYKERLGDLGKEGWRPDASGKMNGQTRDEWYKERGEEFARIEKFSKTQASKDPAFRKETKAFEDLRIDFLQGRSAAEPDLSKTDLGKAVGQLDNLKAASLSTKVFQNDEVIEAMSEETRRYVKQNGGGERRRLIEEWETKQYGPLDQRKRQPASVPPEDFQQMLDPANKNRTDFMTDEDIRNIPLTAQTSDVLQAIEKAGRIDILIETGDIELDNVAPDSTIAHRIANSTNEKLKEDMRGRMAAKGKTADYQSNLQQALKTPGDHSAQRIELMRMGEQIQNIYQVDMATGDFKNDEDANKFANDMQKSRDLLLKIGGTMTGEMRQMALGKLTKNDLVQYIRRVKPAEKTDLKSLISNYIIAAAEDTASKEMKTEGADVMSSSFIVGFMNSP